MKTSLKIYLTLIYLSFIIFLFFSWDGLKSEQVILTIGLTILIFLFNTDIVKDLQSNMYYLIIRPFTTLAIVYLEPFYSMVFLTFFLIIIFYMQPWYKKTFNAATAAIALSVSAYIFQYFYPIVDESYIFTPRFFGVLIIAILINIILDSLFVFSVSSLEKGKFNVDTYITLLTTIRTSLVTIFLGLINVILFYYTNLIGVAIFTFLAYFIKPALQYREIFDNELSTYTNFVLHILKQMDPITHSHSERVKFWTVLLAKKMGLASTEIRQLSQAASWHDIGKIEIHSEILNKPGILTPEEYELVKAHPEQGYQLVKDMHFFKKFLPVIRHHHERFDGTGYPMGLKGENIPLHARIMAITDAFDAMTSDRSYRTGMTMQEAVEELLRHSGTQFDPRLISVFIEALKEEYGENYEHFNKEIIMDVG